MKLAGAVWDKESFQSEKIYPYQVSVEQKLGFTNVHSDLFLMLINPIAPKLTVPYCTVIPQ